MGLFKIKGKIFRLKPETIQQALSRGKEVRKFVQEEVKKEELSEEKQLERIRKLIESM